MAFGAEICVNKIQQPRETKYIKFFMLVISRQHISEFQKIGSYTKQELFGSVVTETAFWCCVHVKKIRQTRETQQVKFFMLVISLRHVSQFQKDWQLQKIGTFLFSGN